MRVLVLVFLAFIFLSSCKKDENQFVGTWKIGSLGIIEGEYLSLKSMDACQRQETVVFTEDTFTTYSYEMQSDSTCLQTVVPVPYTISDNKLNFSLGGTSYSLSIRYMMTSIEITSLTEDGRTMIKQYRKQ